MSNPDFVVDMLPLPEEMDQAGDLEKCTDKADHARLYRNRQEFRHRSRQRMS